MPTAKWMDYRCVQRMTRSQLLCRMRGIRDRGCITRDEYFAIVDIDDMRRRKQQMIKCVYRHQKYKSQREPNYLHAERDAAAAAGSCGDYDVGRLTVAMHGVLSPIVHGEIKKHMKASRGYVRSEVAAMAKKKEKKHAANSDAIRRERQARGAAIDRLLNRLSAVIALNFVRFAKTMGVNFKPQVPAPYLSRCSPKKRPAGAM